MAKVELVMPKMGESIIEATILRWVKNVGERVDADDTILEIATDKVDSEVPAPASGVIKEIFYKENEVAGVGQLLAIIETDATTNGTSDNATFPNNISPKTEEMPSAAPALNVMKPNVLPALEPVGIGSSDKFYSPLVRNIAKEENVSVAELDNILGTGANGRVTKQDVLTYISTKNPAQPTQSIATNVAKTAIISNNGNGSNHKGTNVDIIEMDRMRRMIADHMTMSLKTSAHVATFTEVDVTNIVNWRSKVKNAFEQKYNEKLTFTPVFIEAITKALIDFPMLNSSVEGNNIIIKKDINIGMATAMESGNLIVPVIKNANFLNTAGLAKTVNDLANRARKNQLKPDEIQNGTFTISNIGTFGALMGTPIINQPQVAIIALGAIKKKPVVMETDLGDVIAIRQMMFVSISFDHRVIDGMMGGSFLQRVQQYLENFDINRTV